MRAFRRMPFTSSARGSCASARGVAASGAVVLLSGVASAVIGVGTTLLDRSGPAGLVLSLLVPLLFIAYWLIQGWLVDAGAGMLGLSGRRREFLAGSGTPFLTWIAYSLLGLTEAAAVRSGGSGSPLASALTWLTLPVLVWFLALTVRAVRRVYAVPMLNAVALALLPYAAVAGALLILAGVAGVFRG